MKIPNLVSAACQVHVHFFSYSCARFLKSLNGLEVKYKRPENLTYRSRLFGRKKRTKTTYRSPHPRGIIIDHEDASRRFIKRHQRAPRCEMSRRSFVAAFTSEHLIELAAMPGDRVFASRAYMGTRGFLEEAQDHAARPTTSQSYLHFSIAGRTSFM